MRACAALLTLQVLGSSGCAQLGFGPLPFAATSPSTVKIVAGKTKLTVLLSEDLASGVQVRAALERSFRDGFELEIAALPNPLRIPTDQSDTEGRLAAARKSYINAEFAACLTQVAEDALVSDLLARGQRQLASRLLFWRIACHVGAGHAGEARLTALRFAGHDLEVPPDVEAAAPEVEEAIAQAEHAVAEAGRVPLTVNANANTHAMVAIDGRPNTCATPCTVDVHPGDHVVSVGAEGFTPESRQLRAEGPQTAVAFELARASPEMAAEQWAAGRTQGREVDAASSLMLLSIAVRSRNLAVLTFARTGQSIEVRGALMLDGTLASRSERTADIKDLAAMAPIVMRDLLVRGRVIEPAPPLWKRPLFWTAIGVATATAVTITALLLYHPTTQTSVRF